MKIFSFTPDVVEFSPEVLQHFRDKICVPGFEKGGLTKVQEDVWWSNSEVNMHVDSAPNGYVTQGLILLNDASRVLIYGDMREEDVKMKIARPGGMYILDGHMAHGVLDPPHKQNQERLFAFLAWDMPYDELLTSYNFAHKALNELFEKIGDPPSGNIIFDPKVMKP